MKDDYLFDPDTASEPEPEIQGLEQALAPFGQRARQLELPELEGQASESDSARPAWGRWLAIAAVLLALLGVAPWLLRDRAPSLPYTIAELSGQPTVNGRPTSSGAAELRAGERIVCDATSQLELRVGNIGSVTLEPNSSLRLQDPLHPDAEFQLFLEAGELSAVISAAPRLFQVETPAGLAVDLGCVYRARVEADGSTVLTVEVGQVAFEAKGRRVVVPAGAGIRARLGERPGTPIWTDAEPSLREALQRIDRAGSVFDAVEAELAQVLSLDSTRATLLLWNLMGHHDRLVREVCGQRLSELSPPPEGVDLLACLQGDEEQLEEWKSSLGWSW